MGIYIPRKMQADELEHTHDVDHNMSKLVHMVSRHGELHGDEYASGYPLDQVIADAEAFEDLVHWMNREFCFESALCFIEMVQWRQSVVQQLGMVQDSIVHKFSFSLSASMPRS